MANQFHRLQTQAELHRPERTGRGNPNKITIFESEANFTIPEESGLTPSDFIFSPEDGQYYQDLNTGDVYRFVRFETLGQEQSSLDVVGTTSNNKREAGSIHTSLRVSNDDVSEENPLTLADGELLLLELENGESQVLTVDGEQAFDTSDMRLTLQEFTHAFNVGEFYEVEATVSRLKKGGIWKRLLEYDRDSETITNVAGAGVKAEAIGEITVGFGGDEVEVETSGGGVFFRYDGENYPTRKDAREAAITDGLSEEEAEESVKRFEVPPTTETRQVPREVTQITANLFAELTEGEEITVVDLESKDAVKLTVNNDGNDEVSAFGPGEGIVLDVQDDKIKPFFPIGSLIFGEEGYRESSIKVDPSRIQLAVERARGGDSIGVLTQDVGVGTTSQLSLNNIDETVEVQDGQSLILLNKSGEVKQLSADGAQTLSAGTGTLNITPITIAQGEPTFEANIAVVKEPSYASSGRITVAENQVVLKVKTDGSIGFIDLTGDPDDGTEVTIKADQITLAGQATFLSALEGELEIPEDAVVIVSATEPTERDDGSLLQAGDVWKNTSENDLLYTYDGADWIRSFTQIDGGDIVTGTVTANEIDTSTITISSLDDDFGLVGEDSVNVTIRSSSVPPTRPDGSALQDGDVWIETDEGNRPYTYNDSTDSFDRQFTEIDGGDIITNTIDANKIKVDSLFALNISIPSGGSIESTFFSSGSDGFQINADGSAEFQDVTIGGSSSSIGDNATLENLSIKGTLTVQSGGKIQGSNYFFNDGGGTIAGWIIDSGTLKSSSSGARIELNESDNRVSIFDAVGEKAVMGYLDGLDKNSGSGQWGSSNYGFWAKNGDELVIDGDVEYDSGDWLIENDASYKVLDGNSNEIIRLGTDSGNKGLFIYNTSQSTSSSTDAGRNYFTGDVIASFQDDELVVGDEASNTYMKYDDSTGNLEVTGAIEAGPGSTIDGQFIVNGTIDADKIDVNNLSALNANTGSLTVSDFIESQGYNGSNGFRVNADGTAQFQEVTITNSSGDFNFSPSNGFVIENTFGPAGFSDPKSIGFEADFRTASIYYGFFPPEDSLFIESDGNITLDASLDVDVRTSMEVTGNITTKASSFITTSGGEGVQMGTGQDGDFFMAPTTSNVPDFESEFRYDRSFDRWRSDVDLRTDKSLIYVDNLIDASDESIKENVESIGSALDALCQINAKEYDLIGPSNAREFGFLAQDVEPFFPNLIREIGYTHDDGTTETIKGLSYIQFIPLLVKAIQELNQKLDERSNTP